MLARIYRPAKPATQSGRATTKEWLLEFEPSSARVPDPLMGWTHTSDMHGQIRLAFPSREEAVAYAQRRGLAFEVLPETETKRIIKAYADNFAYQRKQPWTH
jgi:hypothetical protein